MSGPDEAHGGSYLSRTWIRSSRATSQAPTRPVVPNRGSDGNPTEGRFQPIWPYGIRRALMDDSMDPYSCTIIRTPTGPTAFPRALTPIGAGRDLCSEWLCKGCGNWSTNHRGANGSSITLEVRATAEVQRYTGRIEYCGSPAPVLACQCSIPILNVNVECQC